jgi:hypothetical protein
MEAKEERKPRTENETQEHESLEGPAKENAGAA